MTTQLVQKSWWHAGHLVAIVLCAMETQHLLHMVQYVRSWRNFFVQNYCCHKCNKETFNLWIKPKLTRKMFEPQTHDSVRTVDETYSFKPILNAPGQPCWNPLVLSYFLMASILHTSGVDRTISSRPLLVAQHKDNPNPEAWLGQ